MYRAGDEVALTFTFDVAGTPTDPTTVTGEVELPDASTDTLTPTKVEEGVYRVSFVADAAGRYVVSCSGTGGLRRTLSEVVNVAPAMAGTLASLDELKAHLNMTDSRYDDELRVHLQAATGVVERHVCQSVVRRMITRERHKVRQRGRLVLDHVPVLALRSVASEDGSTSWSLDELHLDPVTGEISPVEGGPEVFGDLVVDYVAGYAAVPPNYILACLIIAGHLYELQRPPTPGISPGFTPDISVEPSVYGFAIPNRALELLGGRPPVIA